MNIKRPAVLVILLVGILTLAGRGLYSPSTKAQQSPSNPTAAPYPLSGTTFLSPLPTPLPAVTPTSMPPSPAPTPPAETQLVLAYIARREGIPVQRLRANYEMRREYPLSGRAFWAVKAEEIGGDAYMALMDLADGSFYDDEEALIDAEAEAYLEQYGKLDPDLYERLELSDPDDQVDVAIWVAGSVDIGALWEEIAARRPDLIRYSMKPGDVDDPAVATQERAEYRALLKARMEARTEPLVTLLEARGFIPTAHGEIPMVTARLPKQVILELAKRPEVAVIYLAEAETESELDSAVPSGRTPAVWARGVTGSGVEVAILDRQNVQPDHRYLTVTDSRPGIEDVGQHATGAACNVACSHSTYRGMAPDASIISAGHDGTEDDLVASLPWAADRGADVAVAVIGVPVYEDDLMHFSDRAFDHWARAEQITVVKSAGDNKSGTGYISSPGKAWNVITVGGIDDNNNSAWSDDKISSYSWKNPSNNNGNRTGVSDREKPEVVAVADSVTTVCETLPPDQSVLCTSGGTSHSAPQVGGLAALLMDRNSSLIIWPEAIKAIVMASAAHNIESSTIMRKDSTDDKDGAGAIDAALADTVAQLRQFGTNACDVPCWWGTSTSTLPVGGYLERHFYASRGERVRVAISWWARADCPDGENCLFDRLDTDLDLYVRAPDGTTIDTSNSYDNNYEIVDFIAPQTGQYTIRVKKFAAYHNETSNSLGIAWVKDATYLPDLRNRDGWASELYVRNDGVVGRNVTIHYFETTGDPTPKGSDTCYLNPNQWCWIPVNAQVGGKYRIRPRSFGSAIVGGGEDVTVVVEHQADSKRERTNYTGILPEDSSGSLGWEQTGLTLYAPVIKRQRYGRSSDILVVNTGTQTTDVYFYYYDDAGEERSGGFARLGANDMALVSPYGGGSGGCNTSGTICSARIHSAQGQHIAAVVREYNDADGRAVTTHNLFNAGATAIYFPIVKYERYDMSTGLRIQNVGTAGATVTVNYYQKDGTWKCVRSQYTPPYAARTFYDSSCPGSDFAGNAVASASQSLVGMANEVSITEPQRKKAYSSFQGGTQTAYGPLVYHDFYQNGHTWDTGIAVQNLSTQNASVNLYYYHSDGSPADSQLNQTINGRGSGVFFPPQSNFKGSVLITADRDIAAVVNVINYASSGDTHAMYNASNR